MTAASHRLGLAFAGTFAVLGITVPYLGLWLEGRGLSETQISLVMTTTTWVRAAYTPFVGNRADATRVIAISAASTRVLRPC